MIAARPAINPGLDVAGAISYNVQAVIRAIGQCAPDFGIAAELISQREQIIHVEPRMPLTLALIRDCELSPLADSAQRSRGEQPERRRTPAHPRKITHKGAFDSRATFALRL